MNKPKNFRWFNKGDVTFTLKFGQSRVILVSRYEITLDNGEVYLCNGKEHEDDLYPTVFSIEDWCLIKYQIFNPNFDYKPGEEDERKLNNEEKRNKSLEEIAKGLKICNNCGETKLLKDFPPDTKNISGRKNMCRICTAKRLRQYNKNKKMRSDIREISGVI